MGTTDNNTWTRIQQSVRETERLIGQKQYNLAMIKSRQALEFMVNCLGEKALIVDGDLADSIDQLSATGYPKPQKTTITEFGYSATKLFTTEMTALSMRTKRSSFFPRKLQPLQISIAADAAVPRPPDRSSARPRDLHSRLREAPAREARLPREAASEQRRDHLRRTGADDAQRKKDLIPTIC